MKKQALSFFYFIFIALGITLITAQFGCKKGLQDEVVNPPSTDTGTTFKQLQIPSNFNWKTDQLVTLQVSPLATPIKVTNTLRVTDELGETVFFAERIKMDDAISRQIRIPDGITKVKVKFGTIQKAVIIQNQIISFDYLQD